MIKCLSVLLIFTLFIQCAAFNKKNTPLIVKVEENLIPQKQPARILTAPLYLPLGIVAGLIDIFIIHPISQIPESYKDAKTSLWDQTYNGYFTEMGSFPLRLGLTPVVFSISWLTRSAFDFHFSGHEVQEPDNAIAIEKVFNDGNTEKMSEWMGSCKAMDEREREIARQIFIKYKEDSHPELYNNTVNCLCYNQFEQNEDFFVSQLAPDTSGNLLYCFSNHSSQKGSAELLKIIQNKQLTNEQFIELTTVIYRIGVEKDIETIKEKLRRK
jgi:hypothetical protein